MLEDLVRLKYTHKKAISLGLKSQPIVGREQGLKDVTFLVWFSNLLLGNLTQNRR